MLSLSSPLSLSLPRKGGGNVVALLVANPMMCRASTHMWSCCRERSDAREAIGRAGHFTDRLRSGEAAIVALLALVLAIVLPPFLFLLRASLAVGSDAEPRYGLDNFISVITRSGAELWITTIVYALGSSALAIALGASAAWLVARTDAPFRRIVTATAFLSLAVPVIIKSIGWIMLLGPNGGLVNVVLRLLVGGDEGPIALYSLGGMIFVEGMLWMPVVFLLTLPVLGAMDPSLEEAAATAGADLRQVFQRVTLPLMRPSVVAVFLLALIRALKSFEVPLLIGAPGNLHTLTTAIYESIHTGFLPKYGEASAFAVLLLRSRRVPLAYYYWLTKEASRFATITGKGFRPRRLQLGRWRLPLGSVPPRHPARSRRAAPDPRVGIVPAGLQAAGAGRSRANELCQLSVGLGPA